MRRSTLCLLLGSLTLPSCSKTPNLGKGGAGGGGAGGGGAGGGAGGVIGGAGGAGGLGGGGEGGTVEQPGASVVTLVNGIADHDEVSFCFLPHPGGDPGATPTAPFGFGASQVYDPVELVPDATSLRIVVIAGDLSMTAGLTCAEVEALADAVANPPGGGGAGGAAGAGGTGGVGGAGGMGGMGGAPPYVPPLVARSLPVVPASALSAGWSLLLVPAGCAGPATGDLATTGCGLAFSAGSPTTTLVAVKMSRLVTPGQLGFQAVNGSVAMQPNDVRLQPNMAVEFQIASQLSFGAIEPDAPMTDLSVSTLGDPASAEIRTYYPNTMSQTGNLSLGGALTLGGLTAAELVDGSSYTLLALGGMPSVPPTFWQKFSFVVLRSDP